MDRSLASRYFALPWIGLVLSCLFSTPLSAEMFSMELQKEGRQAERLSTIRQLDGPPGSVLRIASEAGTDFEFTLDRVLRRRSGIKVFSGIAENGARLALVTLQRVPSKGRCAMASTDIACMRKMVRWSGNSWISR